MFDFDYCDRARDSARSVNRSTGIATTGWISCFTERQCHIKRMRAFVAILQHLRCNGSLSLTRCILTLPQGDKAASFGPEAGVSPPTSTAGDKAEEHHGPALLEFAAWVAAWIQRKMAAAAPEVAQLRGTKASGRYVHFID
ncbi:hypothetical protein HPB50_006942 [Hyalomma asiaticum]|uniref:Uncharacterized protein n=1 Tax=Hyalomma asiaticum TaxID=266040 RepID=A0ACB7TAU3_HYAAI|nr:hypothetical protein HPB50_006942 [Hyalomma asiaticum]